jgi:hypothetical protein
MAVAILLLGCENLNEMKHQGQGTVTAEIKLLL